MFNNKKNPEISIIIPVYNAGKDKLSRCLGSIVAQTFKDFEAILIDDGSSDDSGEFCDEFCRVDSRFKVIHQQNSGVSSARNKGICESIGTYLCFIDSDDYVKKEYLELLYTSIKKKNADLSVCGVEVYTEQGLLLFSQQQEELFWNIYNGNVDLKTIKKLLENRYFNYIYAKLYLGDIVRNNNLCFNTELSLGEDTLFVMDYLRHINCLTVSGQTQYVYIKYGTGTLTSEKSVDKYLKLIEVNSYIEETFIAKKWISDELFVKIDERKLMCAEWAVESAEQKKARKDRIIAIKQILNSIELTDAVNRSGKVILDKKILWLYKMKSARMLLFYRKINKKWKQYNIIQNRICSLLVKCKYWFVNE